MYMLEPKRRKRDRLAAKLRASTNDKEELRAIKALVENHDLETFKKEFLLVAECPKCHQSIADEEQWQTVDHETLYFLCDELHAQETKAYQESFQQPPAPSAFSA